MVRVMRKKVSVIIPTYNRQKLLIEAINSVLSQTYQNYEIIIIDDASQDLTLEVVKNYLRKYPNKIKFYRLEQNMGPAYARNVGLELAKGNYIKFLDSDDILLPECLEHQVKFLQKNLDVDVVYSWFSIVDAHRNVLEIKKPTFRGNLLEVLVTHNPFPLHTFLFKREDLETIGGFDTTLRYGEDWDLLIRLSLEEKKFDYIGKILVEYCMHHSNISFDPDRILENGTRVIKKLLRRKNIHPKLHQLCYLGLFNIYMEAFSYAFRLKNMKLACKILKKMFKELPRKIVTTNLKIRIHEVFHPLERGHSTPNIKKPKEALQRLRIFFRNCFGETNLEEILLFLDDLI